VIFFQWATRISRTDMGPALSLEEKKMLLPHLQGFNPQTLSGIIWDTINLIGVDDQRERFGIHFDEPPPDPDEETEEPNESSDDKKDGKKKEDNGESSKEQMVNFWDGDDIQSLPLSIFSDILVHVGENTVQEYEQKYNLEEEKVLKIEVDKLKLALEYLSKKMQSMNRLETALEYREKIDKGQSSRGSCTDLQVVESARERRGTQMWSAGKNYPEDSKRSKRGMMEIMFRLPGLQKAQGFDQKDKLFQGAAEKVRSMRSIISRLPQKPENEMCKDE